MADHAPSQSSSSFPQTTTSPAHPPGHRRPVFAPIPAPPSLATFQHFSDLRTTNTARETVSDYMQNQPAPGYTTPCSCITRGAVAPLTCEQCARTCETTPCHAALSSECTDQCVVIPCHDPHPGMIPCDGGIGGLPCEPCDVVCPDGPECTALDDFFQCCTDYHGYSADSRSFPSDPAQVHSGFTWDPSLAAFLCDCSDPPIHFSHPQATGSTVSSTDSASPTPQLSPSPSFHSIVQPSPIPSNASAVQGQMSQYYTTPPSTESPQPQALLHRCEWGGCYASFSSLAELVGHVNLQHLRLPPSLASNSSLAPMAQAQQRAQPLQSQPQPQRQAPMSSAEATALACMWADCQIYPTPQSIPGPSTGNTADRALGILASHLLQDHLGLPVPASGSDTTPPTDSDVPHAHAHPDAPPAQSPPAAPPTPMPEHDCSSASAHVCRWAGCSRTFVSCDELTTHITAAHVGGGRAHYDCFWEGCRRHGDNGFTSKQKILRHLQSHTGHRPFQCKICQQNFSEAATLAQHMRRHTQEKPYVCDFPGCGKAFAITGALTIHKRTHSGHKPFKCKFCDRAFAESSNLSKHLRTHTGARPYHCTEPGCGKTFARPDQLARHRIVHKKKSVEVAAV